MGSNIPALEEPREDRSHCRGRAAGVAVVRINLINLIRIESNQMRGGGRKKGIFKGSEEGPGWSANELGTVGECEEEMKSNRCTGSFHQA